MLDGFIKNFQDGLLTDEVIDLQGIRGKENDPGLKAYMENRIGYAAIAAKFPTPEEWTIARNVSTNLVPLTAAETNALIKHADSMAELFTRLFCPGLLVPQP